MKRIPKRASGYSYEENVLYKLDRNGSKRIVPPVAERQTLCANAHSEMGHLGINKIVSLLGKRFYFSSMRDMVKQELARCDACVRTTKAVFKEDPLYTPSLSFRLSNAGIWTPLDRYH
jgi:hypothetical protein